MQTESVNTSAHDRELNQILAAYLEAAEVGSAPDPAEYQRRHPAFAAELAEFFALRQEVEGVAAPLRAALAGATVASLKALQELVLQLGDFRIVREIGRGGMGIVYEAQQLSLGRRVALKVLPFAGALDARQLQRFKTEAQAAAQLHHTHIVPVHFVGCERGVHFYAMQYIEGQSLAAVIQELRRQRRPGDRGRVSAPSNEPGRVSTPSQETAEFAQGTTDPSGEGAPAAVSLSPCLRVSESAFFQTAARLAIQAAEALEHAHEMGVVHRDIKPANLLLDERGQLWVTDFGLARLQSDAGLTVTGDLLGTLRYMSPEQALGQRTAIDHRTDVYSLGVTLYELLTLEPAFGGADRQAVLQKIAFEEPRPPCRVNAAIPRDLETIVLKAMAKDSSDRYATAQALADDLRRFLEHRPILARRPTLWQRARKWLQRNPGLAWAAMAGLLLGSVVSVWKYVDERAARHDTDAQRQRAEQNFEEAQRQTLAALSAKGEALGAKQQMERERDTANQNLYFADLRLGLVDWNAGNVARLSSKLRSHIPQDGKDDLRGWEWYYLLSLCHQEERTLLDHEGEVYAIAWSPDGRYVATASADATARVWDAASGRLVRTFHQSRMLKKGVAWSPDSRRLAWGAVADDNAVYVWHVPTDEIQVLRGHTSSVWTVAWSPDGKYLASGGMDYDIRLWEPATGSSRVLEKCGYYIECLAWHPDGKLLASAGREGVGVKIWDVATGQLVKEDLGAEWARAVGWSHSGNHLAVTYKDQCIIYQTADWSRTAQWFAHNGHVNGLAWSPDGSQLATAGSNCLIKLWNPLSGACLATLRGHLNRVNSVAWDPSGRRLASAGMDATVRIWSVPLAPKPRCLNGRTGGTQAIVWGEAPDTLRSLNAAKGSITLWNTATGRRLEQTPVPRGYGAQFSSDGRLAAVGGDPLGGSRNLVYDARSGKPVQTAEDSGKQPLAFSPDASQLVLGSNGDIVVRHLHNPAGHFRYYLTTRAASWSADGHLLAIAGGGDHSDDGYSRWAGWIHVFDIQKRQRILKLRHGSNRVQATAVTWSPNGQNLVSGNEDGLSEVWEIPAGRKVVSVQLHTADIHALAWSPDGRRIASGGADQTVRIWDPTNGEELLKLEGPTGTVTQVLWSTDGHRLAAASGDGSVYVWDASAGYAFNETEKKSADGVRNLTKQANDLLHQEKHVEAIPLFEQLLKEQKVRPGPDHRETLNTMSQPGFAYLHAGLVQEAIALDQQTLERRKASLGPDHRETLTSMNNLAVAYGRAGRLSDAIALLAPMLEKQKANAGPDDSQTLKSILDLALWCQEAGKLDQADELLRDLLGRQRKKPDSQGTEVAATLAGLGLNLLKQERYGEAESLLRECLTIRTEKLADNWLRFNAMSLLGGALLGQQKYAEAKPLLLQGYEGMQKREQQLQNPIAKRRPLEAAERLVRLYEAMNQPEKAAAWREKAKPKPPEAATGSVQAPWRP